MPVMKETAATQIKKTTKCKRKTNIPGNVLFCSIFRYVGFADNVKRTIPDVGADPADVFADDTNG